MKQLIHITLILCYSISVTGMYVDLHYCSGDIAELSINYNGADSCCCDEDEESIGSCCFDKDYYFKVSDNQNYTPQSFQNFDSDELVQANPFFLSAIVQEPFKKSKYQERQNLPPPDIQIEYCTFLI